MGLGGGRTNARALKKLTSNRVRHSSGVLSAMRFTGDKVPWLTIRPSSLENRLIVVSTAWGPIWSWGIWSVESSWMFCRGKSKRNLQVILGDDIAPGYRRRYFKLPRLGAAGDYLHFHHALHRG